ncbi:hypothetical protein DQ04_01801060 [Trypanosoma grayi]|uniref:hypothetical protein n=1 Tax=Trypanosoma grayi TaxID=71804 RepID=UPI0004F4AEF1|nr:hypothetical protein DQ04_01801060 [Trypanosoma grayi]KEG12321.1 hypothetical protein DQ04_01801060 [Trypanosoma grayi]
MACEVVTIVFDLRYADMELFESARSTFITTVGEMLALSCAAALVKGGACRRVEVFAANASRLVPVWNATHHASNAAEAVQLLNGLAPLRCPSRETDQCVVDALQELQRAAGVQRNLLFFTTFTTINDFSRLIHAAKLLAIPFMDSVSVSIHLDVTALTTTVLVLTPAIRCVRSPIAPSSVRGAVQQALTPFLQLQQQVNVSLRFGRYTVPCRARRSFFLLPSRCCAAEDIGVEEASGDAADRETLVLCGRVACTSQYERERWTAREAVLTVDGIVGADAVSDDMLYGDGWVLRPMESDAYDRSPAEWLHHLATELREEVLLLTTQQPLLDPPHQLALPCSTFVGFFLQPTQLYLRSVIPHELRVERVESVGAYGTRHRLDAALAGEIKSAADALRGDSERLLEGGALGVCRLLAQLRPNQRLLLHIEKCQAPARRGGAYPLHAQHR